MAQQPSRTVSAVDEELASLCGEASSPYAERVRVIYHLPSNLAPEQLERCRAFSFSWRRNAPSARKSSTHSEKSVSSPEKSERSRGGGKTSAFRRSRLRSKPMGKNQEETGRKGKRGRENTEKGREAGEYNARFPGEIQRQRRGHGI